jgi:hypothetical protein
MTEQEFVAQEDAKIRKKLAQNLRYVRKHGQAKSVWQLETFLINGLIELSPPRPGFPYNHYKLTPAGELLV